MYVHVYNLLCPSSYCRFMSTTTMANQKLALSVNAHHVEVGTVKQVYVSYAQFSPEI